MTPILEKNLNSVIIMRENIISNKYIYIEKYAHNANFFFSFVSFWADKTDFTPESRLETHKQKERLKQKQEEEANSNKRFQMQDYKPKERKYFSDDGRPYSFNDPKYNYILNYST